MATVQVDDQLREAIHKEMTRLQAAAISGRPIPMPQRTAMRGQAAALFEQWLELEAARFNDTTSDYRTAITQVETAITDLHAEIDRLDDAIKVVEKATAAVRAVDGLLKIAIENLPIGLG